MIRRGLITGLLFLAAAAPPTPARAASSGGATSLQIPPDPRSEAMGRAPAAITRGPYAAWGNPGGLGLSRGVQVVDMSSQLVPSLAEDVWFKHSSLMAGWSPPGFAIPFGGARLPLNLTAGYNYSRLDYGAQPPFVTPTGSGSPHEVVHGGALAVGLGDYLGIGVTGQRVKLDLYPLVPSGTERVTATAWNYGALVRAPMYVSVAPESGFTLSFDRSRAYTFRVTPTAGVSWTGRGKPIVFDHGGADPLPATRREAVGLDLGILPVGAVLPYPDATSTRFFRGAHVLSVSAALGRDKDLNPPYPVVQPTGPELSPNARNGISNYRGVEVKVLDVFAYRWGWINDEAAKITGNSHGWGVSLFEYLGVDYAVIPQAQGLDRVTKVSAWVRIPLDGDAE